MGRWGRITLGSLFSPVTDVLVPIRLEERAISLPAGDRAGTGSTTSAAPRESRVNRGRVAYVFAVSQLVSGSVPGTKTGSDTEAGTGSDISVMVVGEGGCILGKTGTFLIRTVLDRGDLWCWTERDR